MRELHKDPVGEWMLDQIIELGGSLLHLWKRFLDLYLDPVPSAWNSYSVEQIVEWCDKDIREQKDMDRLNAGKVSTPGQLDLTNEVHRNYVRRKRRK